MSLTLKAALALTLKAALASLMTIGAFLAAGATLEMLDSSAVRTRLQFVEGGYGSEWTGCRCRAGEIDVSASSTS